MHPADSGMPIPIAVKNSVINTAITVVLSVFISTLSAYGFARIDFPGREPLFKIYLFTLMVPSFLNIIPQFIILKGIHIPGTELNLIGTRAGLILVYVSGLEYRQILHTAVETYDRREEQYKRVVSTQLHLLLMMIAHEYLNVACSEEDSKRKKSDVAVDSLIRYLNAHYTEQITSGEIAERFEMNFDYLNRVFSSATGSTIFYYINMLRISNAKQLITTTNLTFAEVAYLVGIEDRYYFTRLFKRYVGMTPTEYYRAAHSLPFKEGDVV